MAPMQQIAVAGGDAITPPPLRTSYRGVEVEEDCLQSVRILLFKRYSNPLPWRLNGDSLRPLCFFSVLDERAH